MGIWRRFKRDKRGVAAVEFALIAPAMILLYFGVAELCQAIIADRKASHVASSVGDLVAQTDKVVSSDLSDIFGLGATVMAPFPTGTLQMRLTSVTANASGTPKVDWSVGYNGFGALAKGGTVVMPMTMVSGDSYVMAESQYRYTSAVQYVVPNALTFSHAYYLRPRRSSQVTCSDC